VSDPRARFERYVAGLSDEDALVLNSVVSRRAALIYGPMYAGKREVNLRASRGYMLAAQRASRATPARV
jgi:hypothetical protein